MRHVLVVAEQQLQGVRSLRQRQHHLGLSAAQMNVIVVGGDWLIERHHVGVDQEVMVSGERLTTPAGATPISFNPILTVKRSGTRMPSTGWSK